MSLQIISPLTSLNQWIQFLNKHSTARHYVQGTEIFISCWDFNKLVIGDVSNAFVRGAVCAKYTLEGTGDDDVLKLLGKFDYDPSALLNACKQLEFNGKYDAIQFLGMKVIKSEERGVDTFSPFHFCRLKPITEIPKKWSIAHVLRLLANDQFYDLRTTSGDVPGPCDRNELMRKLVESPSGWWLNGGKADGEELGINCHHFDYKRLTVRLTALATPDNTDRTICPVVH